mmetsp:Transcript_120950/g.349476  ORF Transcript_120950/g.349476 Transcript_120950/m.349476 type:complete len:226 (+) Transcript_120950:794-1471(+)
MRGPVALVAQASGPRGQGIGIAVEEAGIGIAVEEAGLHVTGHCVVLREAQRLGETCEERARTRLGLQRLQSRGQHELQAVYLLPAMLPAREEVHGLRRGRQLLLPDDGQAAGGRGTEAAAAAAAADAACLAGVECAAPVLLEPWALREACEGDNAQVLGLRELRPPGHDELRRLHAMPALLRARDAVHDLRRGSPSGREVRPPEHVEPGQRPSRRQRADAPRYGG